MTVVGALTVVRGKAIGLLVVPRLIFILLLVMEVLEDYNRYVMELEDFDPSVVAEAIVEATVLWWWCERERELNREETQIERLKSVFDK